MGRHRSPNYPAVGLSKAVEDARSLWNNEKRSAVAPKVAAKAWNYTSYSGPARSRLSALKKYGFLDDSENGVRLTERGITVSVHKPDDREYLNALRKAALQPALFQELTQTHLDASDDAITTYLITKQHFSPEGAKQATKAFKDTISVAKLQDSLYTPFDDGGNGKRS